MALVLWTKTAVVFCSRGRAGYPPARLVARVSVLPATLPPLHLMDAPLVALVVAAVLFLIWWSLGRTPSSSSDDHPIERFFASSG